MINRYEVKNLKSVKRLSIECSNVNLLVGTNSSGKSTLIQALLVAAQNNSKLAGFNGELTSLGRYEDIKCVHSNEREISIRLNVGKIEKEFLLYRDPISSKPYFTIDNDQEILDLDFVNRHFQYLSCHRIGPKKFYEKNLSLFETIGTNGEYAISYLNTHGIDPIATDLCKDEGDYTLLGQVNWWLSYIMNATISTEEIIGADMVQASYTTGGMFNVKPVNIGAGVSYLISILIMCLSAPENGVIVIENPEIHLHPLAQSRVCEFIYFIANTGRQVFIETHSDHIFNGFRAGIATNQMDKSAINIQFVYLSEDNTTSSIKVDIGKFGNINNQVDNLFDQFDIDLNRMLGI